MVGKLEAGGVAVNGPFWSDARMQNAAVVFSHTYRQIDEDGSGCAFGGRDRKSMVQSLHALCYGSTAF